MKKKSCMVIVIILALFALSACSEEVTYKELPNSYDENNSEILIEEITHTIFTIEGLSLEKPIDWGSFVHPNYNQIWIHPPSDNPRRREQTRVQIFTEPVGERGYDINNWVLGLLELPPITELGGVVAYGGEIGVGGRDSFMISENAKGQIFDVFHNERFYMLRFMTSDGNYWEELERIRDSIIFN